MVHQTTWTCKPTTGSHSAQMCTQDHLLVGTLTMTASLLPRHPVGCPARAPGGACQHPAWQCCPPRLPCGPPDPPPHPTAAGMLPASAVSPEKSPTRLSAESCCAHPHTWLYSFLQPSAACPLMSLHCDQACDIMPLDLSENRIHKNATPSTIWIRGQRNPAAMFEYNICG